jgi:hypothetical protein
MSVLRPRLGLPVSLSECGSSATLWRNISREDSSADNAVERAMAWEKAYLACSEDIGSVGDGRVDSGGESVDGSESGGVDPRMIRSP